MPAKFVITIWVTEATVSAGKTVEAFARVENQGDASGQVQVSSGNVVAVSIDPGKYADFTLTFTAPSAVGDYKYTYEAYIARE